MELNKTTVISLAAAVAIIGGGLFYLRSDKDEQPANGQNSISSDATNETEDDDYSLTVDVNSLRDDLPLYPGVKHEPLPMMGEGYYRWNIEAPESDMTTVSNDIKKLAADKGWTQAGGTTGAVTHEHVFEKDGDKVVVTVRADGDDKRPVYYEFMTKKFMEDNNL